MPNHMATPIELTERERAQLEAWSRRRSSAQALAQRSRIVLLAAEGRKNVDIARELGVHRPMVTKWRNRFAEQQPRRVQGNRARVRGALGALILAPGQPANIRPLDLRLAAGHRVAMPHLTLSCGMRQRSHGGAARRITDDSLRLVPFALRARGEQRTPHLPAPGEPRPRRCVPRGSPWTRSPEWRRRL